MFASLEVLSPSFDGNLEIYRKGFQTTRHLLGSLMCVFVYSAATGACKTESITLLLSQRVSHKGSHRNEYIHGHEVGTRDSIEDENVRPLASLLTQCPLL